MDKLSEYIPIVIILVSILFSIIGKKKKQDNVTQETTLPGKRAGEFMDEMNLPQTVSSSSQKKFDEKTKRQTFNRPETVRQKEMVPSFSPSTPILEVEEEKVNPLFSFEEEDDVMKAIIYAEIINKREY